MTPTNQFSVTEMVNTLVIYLFLNYLAVSEPHSYHPRYFKKKKKFQIFSTSLIRGVTEVAGVHY